MNKTKTPCMGFYIGCISVSSYERGGHCAYCDPSAQRPQQSVVLCKLLWPLCSQCALQFLKALLALHSLTQTHTRNIFLTLSSSRLTLGHVNSAQPISWDQSHRRLFAPEPYVSVCVVEVCRQYCLYLCWGISVLGQLLWPFVSKKKVWPLCSCTSLAFVK